MREICQSGSEGGARVHPIAPTPSPAALIRSGCFWSNSGVSLPQYWNTFVELIATPFQHAPLIWGIVPLYFGLLLNELTSPKANFRTAVQTGFSFLWAAAQWLYPYFRAQAPAAEKIDYRSMLPINLTVTAIVLLLGLVALVSGFRRKFPKYCAFLGHTRFSNYFMILLFPIQAHFLAWSWERLAVIGLSAVPVWFLLHFGLMPIRTK